MALSLSWAQYNSLEWFFAKQQIHAHILRYQSIPLIPLRDALGTIRVRAYRIVCPKTKGQTQPDSKWGQSTRAQWGD